MRRVRPVKQRASPREVGKRAWKVAIRSVEAGAAIELKAAVWPQLDGTSERLDRFFCCLAAGCSTRGRTARSTRRPGPRPTRPCRWQSAAQRRPVPACLRKLRSGQGGWKLVRPWGSTSSRSASRNEQRRRQPHAQSGSCRDAQASQRAWQNLWSPGTALQCDRNVPRPSTLDRPRSSC
eukprot:scaffold17413_cov72-Phaeocystis_antarctica.AAC.4